MTCGSCSFLFVPKTTPNEAHLLSFLMEKTLYELRFESFKDNRETTEVVSTISGLR